MYHCKFAILRIFHGDGVRLFIVKKYALFLRGGGPQFGLFYLVKGLSFQPSIQVFEASSI